jgi:hypothetical protein
MHSAWSALKRCYVHQIDRPERERDLEDGDELIDRASTLRGMSNARLQTAKVKTYTSMRDLVSFGGEGDRDAGTDSGAGGGSIGAG